MPVVLQAVIGLLLSGVLAFNGLMGLSSYHTYNGTVKIHSHKVPYILQVSDNKMVIKYEKKGDDVTFSYEKDQYYEPAPEEKEYVSKIVEHVVEHNKTGRFRKMFNGFLEYVNR